MTRDRNERAKLMLQAIRSLPGDPVLCWLCLLEWAALGGTSEDLN